MQHPPGHQARPHPGGHHRPSEPQPEEQGPGRLSQGDPEPARSWFRRPPIWVIVIVVVFVLIIVVHAAGG